MSARQSIQCVEIQRIRLIRLQHTKLQHVGRTIGSTGKFVKVSDGGGSMDALAKRLYKKATRVELRSRRTGSVRGCRTHRVRQPVFSRIARSRKVEQGVVDLIEFERHDHRGRTTARAGSRVCAASRTRPGDAERPGGSGPCFAGESDCCFPRWARDDKLSQLGWWPERTRGSWT
jgi:hypothetical protein